MNAIKNIAVTGGVLFKLVGVLILINSLLVTATFASTGNEMNSSEVLTLAEAAKLLRITPQEMKAMVLDNHFPGRQIGSHWRFSRSALVAWLAGDSVIQKTAQQQSKYSLSAFARQPSRLLSEQALAEITATGVGSPDNSDDDVLNTPDTTAATMGEKPDLKTADEVFLRDQAILLKPGQITLELGLAYSKSDQQAVVTALADPDIGSVEALTDSEQSFFTTSVNARYGLFNNFQLFSNIALINRSSRQLFGGQEISRNSDTEFSNVTAGFRYAALQEGDGYPSVILSLDGGFPVNDSPYSIGGSMALTKSIDPAVLFANVGYRHHLNGSVNDLSRIQTDNQFDWSFGFAYALNDTLTLSTSFSGIFTSEKKLNDIITLPSRERYRLRFGLTSYLAKGLYVEPFVSFAVNGSATNALFGLSLPYTF